MWTLQDDSTQNWSKCILPRAHALQGVKQSVCPSVVIVVSTKIARSRDLGIWATRKHNESIEIFEKRASLCFESFGKAHKRHKHCIFVGYTYQPHPMWFLLMCKTYHNVTYICKGHQQAHDRCTAGCRCSVQGMYSRELVMNANTWCIFYTTLKCTLDFYPCNADAAVQ